MAIRVVQLGSARDPAEGTRIGTVRRPPRGVPKERFARDDWYDAWLPQLAPSAELVKEALTAETPRAWETFVRKYRREMGESDNARLIALLAALSHTSSFSVGCYCDDEAHCHRSILRDLLAEQGAELT
jgi:uncharacterized protein YeaO (DUF488 family)